MADDHTQQPNGGGTLEERIMSRFDTMEVRLNGIDARLSALEVKVEDRPRETRPIWEQALAEINNLTVTVNNLAITVNNLAITLNDLAVTVNRRFDEVERRLTTVEASLAVLVEDVHAVRAKQRSLERRVTDLEQKPA